MPISEKRWGLWMKEKEGICWSCTISALLLLAGLLVLSLWLFF